MHQAWMMDFDGSVGSETPKNCCGSRNLKAPPSPQQPSPHRCILGPSASRPPHHQGCGSARKLPPNTWVRRKIVRKTLTFPAGFHPKNLDGIEENEIGKGFCKQKLMDFGGLYIKSLVFHWAPHLNGAHEVDITNLESGASRQKRQKTKAFPTGCGSKIYSPPYVARLIHTLGIN